MALLSMSTMRSYTAAAPILLSGWVHSIRSATLGYEDKGDGDVPGRRYFVKGNERARAHHLNFYELNSPGWTIHISFGEYLKAHQEVANEYADLKLRLAEEFPTDRCQLHGWKGEVRRRSG